ncbi:pilin [Candidatus Saccharibacteria bacterium]|nr:pilin [Candidatus Saccharibacteria bacterium]
MSIWKLLADVPSWELPGAGGNNSEDVLAGLVNGVFFALGILAVGFIIYAGVKMQLSRGSASKMVEARSMLVFSVIGLVVAGSAWAIISFILGRFSE